MRITNASARLAFILVALFLAPADALRAAGSPTPTAPNVIVIVTDDQGAADVGCYGVKDLVTPAMDGLAARGVRFTSSAGDVLTAEDKHLFLANLATDIGEKTNLAGQHPEIVKHLSRLREDWLAGQKDAAPESAPSQDPKGNER